MLLWFFFLVKEFLTSKEYALKNNKQYYAELIDQVHILDKNFIIYVFCYTIFLFLKITIDYILNEKNFRAQLAQNGYDFKNCNLKKVIQII